MTIRIAKNSPPLQLRNAFPNSTGFRLEDIVSVLESVFQPSNVVTSMVMNGHILAAASSLPKEEMPATNADTSPSILENAFSELVRQAVRAEVRGIVRLIRDEDRLLLCRAPLPRDHSFEIVLA